MDKHLGRFKLQLCSDMFSHNSIFPRQQSDGVPSQSTVLHSDQHVVIIKEKNLVSWVHRHEQLKGLHQLLWLTSSPLEKKQRPKLWASIKRHFSLWVSHKLILFLSCIIYKWFQTITNTSMNKTRFTPSFNHVLGQEAHSTTVDREYVTAPNSGSLTFCH